MAVAYFSRVKFIPARDGVEFTEEQERFLRRPLGSLLQSDITYHSVVRRRGNVEEEEREIVGVPYQLTTLYPWHDGRYISGSMIKDGSLLSVEYDRDTAEVANLEVNETVSTPFQISLKSPVENSLF